MTWFCNVSQSLFTRPARYALNILVFFIISSVSARAGESAPAALPDVTKLSDPAALLLFLVFLLPGFISVQIYSLLVPTKPSDFSKRVNEIFGYSAIHYAVTIWLLIWSNWNIAAVYAVVFILPIVWPPLLLTIRRSRLMRRLPLPDPTPWDGFFRREAKRPKNPGLEVRVKTAGGEVIAGHYGSSSIASTFPSKPQLYLESAYVINPDGSTRTMSRTAGMIVNCDKAEYVVFRT